MGMRTNEARLLARDDVDLDEGVISIRQTKGEQQRYVAIHPTLAPILRQYDMKEEELYPGREYFFPSPRGEHLSNTWITDVFREMWNRNNASHATHTNYGTIMLLSTSTVGKTSGDRCSPTPFRRA